MSRYIDADAIKYFVSVTNDGCLYRVAFKDEIDKIPTADVVPMDFHNKVLEIEIKKQENMVEVVRCKDCQYWQEYQEGHYPNELCPWDKNETTDEDDYCSYGERREDDRRRSNYKIENI